MLVGRKMIIEVVPQIRRRMLKVVVHNSYIICSRVHCLVLFRLNLVNTMNTTFIGMTSTIISIIWQNLTGSSKDISLEDTLLLIWRWGFKENTVCLYKICDRRVSLLVFRLSSSTVVGWVMLYDIPYQTQILRRWVEPNIISILLMMVIVTMADPSGRVV